MTTVVSRRLSVGIIAGNGLAEMLAVAFSRHLHTLYGKFPFPSQCATDNG